MDNRSRLLDILTYLWKYTDSTHHTTIVQIQEYLESNGLKATRQTITEDIQLLQEMDFIDLKCERKTQNHYYISKRFFDEADVKVLCDAVRSSYFISRKNASDLIITLKQFAGPGTRNSLDSPSFVDASIKTKNNDVIRNACRISKAITNQKQISFNYFDYDVRKNKVYKHNKKYTVSPYAMVINDGKYYIAAYQEDEEKVKTFRIDKIDKLMVLAFDNYPQPKDFKIPRFESQTDMLGGYESQVELLCHKETMYGIIDKFGKDVQTIVVDDDYFKVIATADVSATFFGWVVGFNGKIQIVGPQSVREDYLKCVTSVCDTFKA